MNGEHSQSQKIAERRQYAKIRMNANDFAGCHIGPYDIVRNRVYELKAKGSLADGWCIGISADNRGRGKSLTHHQILFEELEGRLHRVIMSSSWVSVVLAS